MEILDRIGSSGTSERSKLKEELKRAQAELLAIQNTNVYLQMFGMSIDRERPAKLGQRINEITKRLNPPPFDIDETLRRLKIGMGGTTLSRPKESPVDTRKPVVPSPKDYASQFIEKIRTGRFLESPEAAAHRQSYDLVTASMAAMPGFDRLSPQDKETVRSALSLRVANGRIGPGVLKGVRGYVAAGPAGIEQLKKKNTTWQPISQEAIERASNWNPWQDPDEEARQYATDYYRKLPKQDDYQFAARTFKKGPSMIVGGALAQIGQIADWPFGIRASLVNAGASKEGLKAYDRGMGMAALGMLSAIPGLSMGGAGALEVGLADSATIVANTLQGASAVDTLSNPYSTNEQRNAAYFSLGLMAGTSKPVLGGLNWVWKNGRYILRIGPDITGRPKDVWSGHTEDPHSFATEGWEVGLYKQRPAYNAIDLEKHIVEVAHEIKNYKSEKTVFLEPGGTSWEVQGSDSRGHLTEILNKREVVPQTVSIHNHPEGTPPSPQDISHLLDEPFREFVVVTKTGYYRIWRPARFMKAKVLAEISLCQRAIGSEVNRLGRELTGREKSFVFWHAFAHKAEGMGFKVSYTEF